MQCIAGRLCFFVVSSFASTMLVEAMQRIPGNAHLTQRWEFCAVVGHYHGPRAQRMCRWLYNISLQSTNVAAMIVSAQLLDVPDPYYSDAAMFDTVLGMIERACTALFRQLEPGIRQGAS